MRRPGNLAGLKMKPRALGGLGQYGYSLPKGNYGLSAAVQYCCGEWFPGITDGTAMAAAAVKENEEIKAKIATLITKATNAGDAATAQEMQNIAKELNDTDKAVRAENPPYPDAPLTLAYRKALKLVEDLGMWIKTPVVASATANAVSSVIPNSSSNDVYDTTIPSVSSNSSKTILMVGGLGLGLLVLLMVSRILKRKKTMAPSARRKRKK